jgi:PKD repeat protein
VLKVKTRAAAGNPALASVGWRVAAEGLALEVDTGGAVRAVDAAGEVVFAAPPATMWDSPRLDTALLAALGEPAPARVELDPGRVEAMPVELSGHQLVVKPDLAMLADPATAYPVLIDPSFGFNLNNWAPVHKSRPNTAWPSGTTNPREVMRVGYDNWSGCGSNCGVWRSHIRFNISGISGKSYRLVSSPKFEITLLHSASCSSTPVALWRTSSIAGGGDATWNSMSGGWLTNFGTKSVRANGTSCGQPPVEVAWSSSSMKDRLQGAMNAGNSTFTFGLRASDEGDRNQWKKFSRTGAFLSGTFNSVPKVPTAVKPQGDCVGTCTSPATVRVVRPFVQAKVENPLGGNVTAEFELRDHATGSVVATASRTVSNGAIASWQVPSLTNGKEYRFRVRARNTSGIVSAYSSDFRFKINTAGPSTPASVGIFSTGSCYQSCASPAMLRDRRPTFKATTGHPFGDNLNVRFEVQNAATGAAVAAGTVNPVTAGTTPSWRPPSELPQETTLRLRVQSTDQYSRTSSWSGWFTFTVDTNSPNPPAVSSSLYSPTSSGTWNGGVGVPGAFSLGPNSSNDVVRYEWRFNGGTVSGVDVVKGSATTVNLAPPGDLEQRLEVRSIDHAGNTSGWRDYFFYVRPQPADAGYWKFDEGAGATTASAVGGELTGSLQGGAGWAASGINPDDPAASGSAISLDGTSGFVEMPPAVATNHAAGFTVSAWVKPTTLTGDRTAVTQIGDNVDAFRLYHSETGRWCASVRHADSIEAASTTVCSTITPPTGTWTHLVGVYDRPQNKLRLYVNGGPFNGLPGVPGTVDEVDAPQMWAATGSFRAGQARDGEFWHGLIDEVRTHQRVLEDSEIAHIFQSCRLAACPAVPEPDAVTTVGAWGLEETTGPTTADASGLGNDGTLHGNAQRTAFGHAGSRAVYFDGGAGYIETGSVPVLLTDRSFTVSAWVVLDAKGSTGSTEAWVLQVQGTGASALKLVYSQTADAWRFQVTSHNGTSHTWHNVVASAPVELGVWTHLAAVYDPAGGGQLRLYVNGQLDGSLTGVAVQPAVAGLLISHDNHGWHGTIDLVQAYQGAMTSAMVAQLYAEQLASPAPLPVLAGDWRMDEQQGSFVFDHTLLGNDGFLSGGASWPDAGQAYGGTYGVTLDGISGQVTTGWVPVLTEESFTVSGWVRLASRAGDRTAISLDGQASSAMRLFYHAAQDRLCVQMSHQDTASPGTTTACAGQPPALGAWTQLTGVFDRANRRIALYVDGQPAAAATYLGLEPWPAAGPVVIGRALIDGAPQQWWTGGVARVQAHHGAMTAALVADLYAAQLDPTPMPVIASPANSMVWTAGQLISFAGSASSLGEQLPDPTLSWQLRARDCVDRDDPDCQVELLQSWAGVAGGSFTAPTGPEPVVLELELTASNPAGTASTWIELAPATVELAFTTDPDGLELTAGEVTSGAPFEVTAVVAAPLAISAPDQQDAEGTPYVFDSWAHGGERTQQVLVPATDTSFHAVLVTVNEPPTADFHTLCQGVHCMFDGSPSVDVDGEIVWYAWDFGDGRTAEGIGAWTGTWLTNTYEQPGQYVVTMTVTDDRGATDTIAYDVQVQEPAEVMMVGTAVDQDRADATQHTVQIPLAVQADDLLVLVWTANTSATQAGAVAPAGWATQNTTGKATISGAVYSRTAQPTDAGSTVTVTTATAVRGTLALVAYRNAFSALAYAGTETVVRTQHTTPTAGFGVPFGGWMVSYWADVSNATTTWTPPTGVAVAQTGAETGASHLSWLLADSDGPAQMHGQTATADSGTADAIMFSIVLYPTSASETPEPPGEEDPPAANEPPVAAFTWSCDWQNVCSFSGLASFDPDGEIVVYEWDFGDGATRSGSPTPSHAYASSGGYQVSLTVFDEDGASSQIIETVLVAGETPPDM